MSEQYLKKAIFIFIEEGILTAYQEGLSLM